MEKLNEMTTEITEDMIKLLFDSIKESLADEIISKKLKVEDINKRFTEKATEHILQLKQEHSEIDIEKELGKLEALKRE